MQCMLHWHAVSALERWVGLDPKSYWRQWDYFFKQNYNTILKHLYKRSHFIWAIRSINSLVVPCWNVCTQPLKIIRNLKVPPPVFWSACQRCQLKERSKKLNVQEACHRAYLDTFCLFTRSQGCADDLPAWHFAASLHVAVNRKWTCSQMSKNSWGKAVDFKESSSETVGLAKKKVAWEIW